MAVLEKIEHSFRNGSKDVMYVHFCEGCGYEHPFHTERSDKGVTWEFNGSLESPTFRPSMLINQHDPSSRCHYFLTNGEVQYLSDCFHSLAGKTIALKDLEEIYSEVK